jgi:hypothetical protein
LSWKLVVHGLIDLFCLLHFNTPWMILNIVVFRRSFQFVGNYVLNKFPSSLIIFYFS